VLIVGLAGTGAQLGGYRNIRMASLQQLRKFAVNERICGGRIEIKPRSCSIVSYRHGASVNPRLGNSPHERN
jgi:hypothetical protein